MISKPSTCHGCPLMDQPGFVPADGSGANGVLIVGEAAGEMEAKIGKPFIGAAGFYLDRLLKRVGLMRKDFRIHNCLSCRPPNNKLVGQWYEHQALRQCAQYLDHTIETMQPKVILALGGTALRRLSPYGEILRYRGQPLRYQQSWVLPTFHPSFLLPRKGQADQTRFAGVVIRDLRRAMDIAQHGFKREEAQYLCDPSPAEAMNFVLEYEDHERRTPGYLAFDIETPYKLKIGDEDELEEEEEDSGPVEVVEADPILRISFAFRERHAMSIPWGGPYQGIIERLLGGAGKKAVWNGGAFDVPKIRTHGVAVRGEIYDFMWGWHILQSALPKKLEFVSSFFAHHLLPWKHLNNAEPARYSAIDSDATVCNANGIERELRENGQWDVFKRHSVELDPILYHVGCIQGVHIDREAQEALRQKLSTLEQTLTQQGNEVVPDELKPIKVFKRAIPDGEVFYTKGMVKRCSICGQEHVTKSGHCKGACKNAVIELVEGKVPQWKRTLPFNANSTQQLMAYAKHYRHPLGNDHKTQRESLGKKHVERLARKFGKKHPIYAIALQMRGVRKTLGTYVEGFKPDRGGMIYTSYSHKPRTPRLASASVNLQNVSHRGTAPFAKEVRQTIIPPPGCVFVEADSSAIEAVMVGYFMGDSEYIRYARDGIHDILTCKKLEIPFDLNEIPRLKKDAQYKKLRDVFKVTVHGTSYRMGPRLMLMQYPEIFHTAREAAEAQEFFTSFCPGLRAWQWQTMVQAHKESYLTLPWGYRGYYYDVFSKDRDGTIKEGGDANKCVAFRPQGGAACFLMDNVKMIWDQLGEARRAWMRANLVVHDSYCLAPEKGREEEAIEILKAILTRPIPELDGLQVGCEVSIGTNWAEMQPVEIVRVQ